MPAKRRRFIVIETPPVQAALDRLRRQQGGDRIDLAELIILGAQQKAASLHAQPTDTTEARRRLARRIRSGIVPTDRQAADDVRRAGWTHFS